MAVLVSTQTGIQKFISLGRLGVFANQGRTTVTIDGEQILPDTSFPVVREFEVEAFSPKRVESYRFYIGEEGKLHVICRWPSYEGEWLGFKIQTFVVNGWDSQLLPDEPLTSETETRFRSETRELLEINGMILGVLGAISALAYIGYVLFS